MSNPKNRPWIAHDGVSFRQEMIDSVWELSDKKHFATQIGTPNKKHVQSYLRKLEQQCKNYNAESIRAYGDLWEYWRAALINTDPYLSSVAEAYQNYTSQQEIERAIAATGIEDWSFLHK